MYKKTWKDVLDFPFQSQVTEDLVDKIWYIKYSQVFTFWGETQSANTLIPPYPASWPVKLPKKEIIQTVNAVREAGVHHFRPHEAIFGVKRIWRIGWKMGFKHTQQPSSPVVSQIPLSLMLEIVWKAVLGTLGMAGNGYPMICRGSTGGAPCNIHIGQVMSSQWLNGLSYCDAAGLERQRARDREMYRE